MTNPNVSRRTFTLAAGALGVSFLGCQKRDSDPIVLATAASNKLPRNVPVKTNQSFTNTGLRIYFVQVNDQTEQFDPETYRQMDPRPLMVHGSFQSGDFGRTRYILWGTEKDARKLAANPAVKSVDVRTEMDIQQIGTSDNGNRTIAVDVFPNHRMPAGTHATIPQIVQDWREELKDVDGVVVNPPPPEILPENGVGNVPSRRQILIHFTSVKPDPKILQVITKHPQTFAVKYDGIFTELYCPPCGMG